MGYFQFGSNDISKIFLQGETIIQTKFKVILRSVYTSKFAIIDLAQIFHCAFSTIKSIYLSMVLIIHKNASLTQKDLHPQKTYCLLFQVAQQHSLNRQTLGLYIEHIVALIFHT